MSFQKNHFILKISSIVLLVYCVSFCTNDPLSYSIETKGGTLIQTETPFAENEIIIAKQLNGKVPLCITLENLFMADLTDDFPFTNEITVSLGVDITDAISAGISPKAFISNESVTYGLNGIVSFTFTCDRVACIDDNELSYNFIDQSFEYVNTLAAQYQLYLKNMYAYFLALENELSVSSEAENTLLIGPGVTFKCFCCYINYINIISDNLVHGIETGICIEF